MTTPQEVVAMARHWIGTPFREQAHIRGQGADCVGYVRGVGEELGDLPAGFQITYGQSPDNRRMERECAKYLRPVRQMQIGDVVLIQKAGEPHHMGILADYKWGGFAILHALKPRGEVVEHRLDADWRQSIVAAYRYPSVA